MIGCGQALAGSGDSAACNRPELGEFGCQASSSISSTCVGLPNQRASLPARAVDSKGAAKAKRGSFPNIRTLLAERPPHLAPGHDTHDRCMMMFFYVCACPRAFLLLPVVLLMRLQTHSNMSHKERDLGRSGVRDRATSAPSDGKRAALTKSLWGAIEKQDKAETEKLLRKIGRGSRIGLSGPKVSLLQPGSYKGKLSSHLHLAALSGLFDIVKMLLDADALIDARDQMNNTPILCAASQRHWQCVSYLLERGANPTLINQNATTLLHFLVVPGEPGDLDAQIRLVNICLESGCLVNAKDTYGDSPLIYAAVKGNLDMCSCLLRNGAKVNQPNNFGETPLHKAVLLGNLHLAMLFLDMGANPLIVSKRGKPRDLLGASGQEEEPLLYNLLVAREESFVDTSAINLGGVADPAPAPAESSDRDRLFDDESSNWSSLAMRAQSTGSKTVRSSMPAYYGNSPSLTDSYSVSSSTSASRGVSPLPDELFWPPVLKVPSVIPSVLANSSGSTPDLSPQVSPRGTDAAAGTTAASQALAFLLSRVILSFFVDFVLRSKPCIVSQEVSLIPRDGSLSFFPPFFLLSPPRD
jgi:ankyrin repeat protein